MAEITVTRDIKATAEAVIALVSDVTRIGEWSPETTSCSWTKGSTGPAVGAKFRGTNKNGFHRWTTNCQVLEADSTHFSFHVTYLGVNVADWVYVATPTDAGCTVTETWVDHRNPVFAKLGTIGTGVSDRVTHNRSGMEKTLAALATEAEKP